MKKKRKPLTLAEALQVVLELAQQNALDYETCDDELMDEAIRQDDAIKLVSSIEQAVYSK